MSRVEKYSQGKEVILVAVSPLIKRTLNTLGPARWSYSILETPQVRTDLFKDFWLLFAVSIRFFL